MTQNEYQQKKREWLDEFCKRYRIEEPSEQNIESFNWILDRAYALGKQEEDGIDLKKLDKMLDDALEKETKESLNQWLSAKDAGIVISG